MGSVSHQASPVKYISLVLAPAPCKSPGLMASGIVPATPPKTLCGGNLGLQGCRQVRPQAGEAPGMSCEKPTASQVLGGLHPGVPWPWRACQRERAGVCLELQELGLDQHRRASPPPHPCPWSLSPSVTYPQRKVALNALPMATMALTVETQILAATLRKPVTTQSVPPPPTRGSYLEHQPHMLIIYLVSGLQSRCLRL